MSKERELKQRVEKKPPTKSLKEKRHAKELKRKEKQKEGAEQS